MSTFTRIPFTGYVVRRNLVPNPSFEVDTTGWQTGGSASAIARFTTGSPPFGVARCAITSGAAGTNYAATTSPHFAVVVGQTYTLSAYLSSSGAARTGRVMIRWLDGGGSQISQSAQATASPVSLSAWERVSVTAVAPASAATAQLFVGFDATASDEVFRVDAVQFSVGALVPYVDGSLTPASPTQQYEWLGTPHLSASLLRAADPAIDQVTALVEGPFEYARVPRTIARELLHSSDMRVTYVPATNRVGEYRCLFDTHAEARAAADWFSGQYEFVHAFATTIAGYEWVDGYFVPTGVVTDASYDNRFIVTGTGLQIVQRLPMDKWQLTVPYKEFPL